MEWYEYLASILTGLAVVIPLVVKLVQYVKLAVKEKNWEALLKLVTDLMVDAEKKFASGADRKEWVLTSIKAVANTINYDINYDEVADMIDNLCAFSKKVNPPTAEDAAA